MTYEQFQKEVQRHFRVEDGYFTCHDVSYYPGRVYYTFQNGGGFGFAAYDTLTPPDGRGMGCPWQVDMGRGAFGFGQTIDEAVADEDLHYDYDVA